MKLKAYGTEVRIYPLPNNNNQLKLSCISNENNSEIVQYIKNNKEDLLEQINYEMEERISIMVESGLPEDWAKCITSLYYIAAPEGYTRSNWNCFLNNLDQILVEHAWFLANRCSTCRNKNIRRLMGLPDQ